MAHYKYAYYYHPLPVRNKDHDFMMQFYAEI